MSSVSTTRYAAFRIHELTKRAVTQKQKENKKRVRNYAQRHNKDTTNTHTQNQTHRRKYLRAAKKVMGAPDSSAFRDPRYAGHLSPANSFANSLSPCGGCTSILSPCHRAGSCGNDFNCLLHTLIYPGRIQVPVQYEHSGQAR